MALMRRISSLALQPLLGVLCFFVTFFLVGIWHGRTSEFVIFGVLQGAGVAVNKLWQVVLTRAMDRKGYRTLAANDVYVAFGRGLTFSWFAFSLFWFWAGRPQIDRIFDAIGLAQWLGVWLSIVIGATAALAAWEALRTALLSIKASGTPMLLGRHARVVYASALGVAAFVMTVLLDQPAPAIIYKAF
jgi:alginate O-acetyltransferase complex protein AlgI